MFVIVTLAAFLFSVFVRKLVVSLLHRSVLPRATDVSSLLYQSQGPEPQQR
jgi:hypothetical protein